MIVKGKEKNLKRLDMLKIYFTRTKKCKILSNKKNLIISQQSSVQKGI